MQFKYDYDCSDMNIKKTLQFLVSLLDIKCVKRDKSECT